MFRALLLQPLARFFLILSWIIVGSLAVQGAALAVHQGKHLAQSVQKDENNPTALEQGPCAQCVAFHQSSESPSFAIALSSFVPLVAARFSLEPVDPKTNIVRTCDARGPPSYSSLI